MVQIIRNPKAEQLKEGSARAEQGFRNALNLYAEHAEKEKNLKLSQEDTARLEDQYKIKLSRDPEIRKLQVQAAEKGRQKQVEFSENLKLSKQFDEEDNDYDFEDRNYPTEKKDNENENENDLPFYLDKKTSVGTESPQLNIKTKETPSKSFKPPHSKKKIDFWQAKDPARARNLIADNDRAEKSYNKKIEHGMKKEEQDYKKQMDVHKSTEKYYEKLHESAKAAEEANRSIARQKEKIGEVGGWDRFVKVLNPRWHSLLQSDDAVALDSNIAAQFAGQRQLLGGILSDSDIRFLMTKMVTSDKSKEANEYIADMKMLENDITIAQADIADEIIKENGGYRPLDFQAQIRERSNALYGNKIRQTYDKIKDLPDNAKQLEKVWRRKVPPGTPLTQESAMKYKKMYGKEQGKIEAAKDGYIE
jgi:hypothetical protein